MVDSPNHCPHLGLKQNRAIRFATATPEHRCYVSGEAQEIPVEQDDYCLSHNHVHCPLYMGLSIPSISERDFLQHATFSQDGVWSWFTALSLRDRIIYSVLIVVLLIIIGIYIATALQVLLGNDTATNQPTYVASTMTATNSSEPSPIADKPSTATDTATPAATDTATPAATDTATPRKTSTATPTPLSGTATALVTMLRATPSNTAAPFVAIGTPTASIQPTTAPMQPTTAPMQPTTAPMQPTTAPMQPTTAPIQPTTAPMQPTTAPSEIVPTPEPEVTMYNMTLYFADATGTLLVPVNRQAEVVNAQVVAAAMRELIAGPHGSLQRLIPSNMQVKDIRLDQETQTLTVDLDRHPESTQSIRSIVMTLTEFPSVSSVQLQVNGENITFEGSTEPIGRPILNADNPRNLPTAYSSGTRFLPLYFMNNGRYVRITRLVPKTTEIARATVVELLSGPGAYSDIVQSPIPAGTELRDIRKQGSTAVVVDLTEHFLNATNRQAALDAIILSLTELRDTTEQGERIFTHVAFLVEGQDIATFWGEHYRGPFERPSISTD